MSFDNLGIIEPILKALEEEGYSRPTPIQSQTIPLLLGRKDVLGCAQTGTGKTAAFAVPILQMIYQRERKTQGKPILRSLIITPTRELAIQIDESFGAYGRYAGLKHTVIFGGVKQEQQVTQVKNGVHILVATPGRLLDLIQQGFVHLNDIKLFVLDEADRMLDQGFLNDIKKIIALLPRERQSLFFSATMPSNIIRLADTILTNPSKVTISPKSATADTVQQQLYYTNRLDKRKLLLHILKDNKITSALVFTRTKYGSDRVAKVLSKKGIMAAAIHGDKAQNMRQRVLRKFKAGELRILVATDIASRGIDIDDLGYVINYEIPNVPETYVHRIGRSGRAGKNGHAISICEPEENIYIKNIEKLIGKKIPVVENNPFPQTDKPMTAEERKEWEKEKRQIRKSKHEQYEVS